MWWTWRSLGQGFSGVEGMASVEWGGRDKVGRWSEVGQLRVCLGGGCIQVGRVCCLEPGFARRHHVLHQHGALRRRHPAHSNAIAIASSTVGSASSSAATFSPTSSTQAATIAAELHRQYAQRHACRTTHNEPPLAAAVLAPRRRQRRRQARGGGSGSGG